MSKPTFLADGGEIGGLIRAFDWAATPLGPAQDWPQTLKTIIRVMLNTHHPIFVFWGPEARCFYNDAYSRTIGPERHPGALGQPGRQVWDEIWDIIGPQIELVMAGRGATWHEDHLVPITRHGRREDVWWTYSYSPIDDEAAENGVGGVLVLCNDVTRDHVTREQLQASDERFRSFAENTRDVIYIVDVAKRQLEYLNPAYEQVWGEPRDAILSDLRRWAELLHPEDRETALANQNAVALGGGPIESEYRILRVDGSVRHVRDAAVGIRDDAGRIVRVAGIASDMTDRKQAEAALAASEERLWLAQEAAGIGTWDWDIASGAISWSEQNYRLHGLDPAGGPPAYDDWRNAIHPEDRDRTNATVLEAVARQQVMNTDYRVVDPDGTVRWLIGRGRVLVDPAGRPERMIGVNLDVTERRTAEVRQALLAREVDHRCKNILSVVQSLVRLSRNDDPARLAEAIEGRIVALARSHDMLAAERWLAGGLYPILEGELAPYLGVGRVRLEGPNVVLHGDTVQPLSMVVHELATNAIKYGALSGPAGRVMLTWSTCEELGPGTLRLAWHEWGGPPLAGPPQRLGFGSTLITEVVRSQLGGRIEKRWDRQGLACVILVPQARLHLIEEAPAAASRALGPLSGEEVAPDLAGLRVVIGEQDSFLALDLARTLEAQGCKVIGVAATFEAAQRLCGDGAADIAMLDVMLGGQPSFPLADALLAGGVSVVFTTSYGDFPEWRGAGEGGSVLLHKPVRTDDLIAALARVARRGLHRNGDGGSAGGIAG